MTPASRTRRGGPPHRRSRADLTLLGVVGMIDPPRQEAPAAVAECRAAGITPVMITGDHPATAAAIARRVGILEAGDDQVLTGPALSQMDDAALADAVSRVRVYARVDPEQKIRIVRALQADGQSVAMTGDGVNDAPALRQAEIGVAMGEGGTDVAREAADMVLLDDRFATIVTAVREGRRIYDDIRKFIRYALTGNTGEIWVVFLAPFLGMPVPLLPIHILWVNLITDGLPGLALAEEPAERDVMARPPRPPDESIFARGLGIHVLWVGALIAALTLGTQAWALSEDTRQWQSMVFTVLVFCQLVHSMAIRSESRSLFSDGPADQPFPAGRHRPVGRAPARAALRAVAAGHLPDHRPDTRAAGRRVRRPPGGPVRGRGREAARAPGSPALRRGHRRARWPPPRGLSRRGAAPGSGFAGPRGWARIDP